MIIGSDATRRSFIEQSFKPGPERPRRRPHRLPRIADEPKPQWIELVWITDQRMLRAANMTIS
jgi:hypothetical protein